MTTAGTVTAEGKTKRVVISEIPGLVELRAKDDITAGDGAKHDIIAGKAALATQTTCNVFRLLKECGLPVAFERQISDTSFLAPSCDMLPYEVVVRREAHGSYLKRRPDLEKGHLFPKLVVEFYLKTSGKHWKDHELPKDDPLIVERDGRDCLFRPDLPTFGQQPFLVLDDLPHRDKRDAMRQIAVKVFLALEKAWQLLDRRLVDFKIEFGLDKDGRLLVADVIDNDSWRVLENGQYIDKQGYRDGEALDTVLGKYQLVTKLTEQFGLPEQQLVFWRGSNRDDLGTFTQTLEVLGPRGRVPTITLSAHKEPIRAQLRLQAMVQEVPDTVIIAYVGRSNGLGPSLAPNTMATVITVSASVKDFPEDIWSSLRTPSDNPLLTAMSLDNAVLAALQILAKRNPYLYMKLRVRQEDRAKNVAEIN